MPAKKKIKNLTTPLLLIIATLLLTSFIYLKQSFTSPDQDSLSQSQSESDAQQANGNLVNLPSPDYSSKTSLEQALKNRIDRHNFTDQSLTIKQISQLFWAAQGVTSSWGNKTTSSYKSEYPLSLYLIADNVQGLDSGLYLYLAGEIDILHQLRPILLGQVKQPLARKINQSSFTASSAIIIITADLDKIAALFPLSPQTGVNLTYAEAGSVLQNLYLQAESLNLGLTENVTFDKEALVKELKLPDELTPLVIVSVGNPAN